MACRPRTVLLIAVAAAMVTFAVVQDRVTAAGARRYVALQRDAAAGQRDPVAIDEVLQPAVRQSVHQGLVWSGAVLAAGAALAALAGRSRGA